MLIAKWRHLGALSSPIYLCPLDCASLARGDFSFSSSNLTLMHRGPLQSPLLLCYTCSPPASFVAACLKPQQGFLHIAALCNLVWVCDYRPGRLAVISCSGLMAPFGAVVGCNLNMCKEYFSKLVLFTQCCLGKGQQPQA